MTQLDRLNNQAEKSGQPLSIENLVRQSAEQLKMALPEHMRPERIVRIALTTLRTNPKLYSCNPHSFLAALFQSAQLGLEPNLNGEAWIIPYNISIKTADGQWKKELMAQFQIGAQGLIKLFWNHQNAVGLVAEKVCQHDDFEYDLGTGEIHHKFPPFSQNRGEVIGYYASAQLSNGGRSSKIMSKSEVLEHAKKFSKCWDNREKQFKDDTPWAAHFDAMALKTVLKQLMKLLPKSVEIQKALTMDETIKTKVEANMVDVPNEIEYNNIQDVTTAEAEPTTKENK